MEADCHGGWNCDRAFGDCDVPVVAANDALGSLVSQYGNAGIDWVVHLDEHFQVDIVLCYSGRSSAGFVVVSKLV